MIAKIRQILDRLAGRRRSIPFLDQAPAYREFAVGAWSYGDPLVLSWGEGTTLRIGKYCSIAKGVVISLGGEHRTDWVTTYPFPAVLTAARGMRGHPRSKGDVVIGHDVWIGREAMILSGVTIGDGAVVGARSVVARDIPPYAIVAGNPARVVRHRFDRETIAALRAIAWWDWSDAEVAEALPFMLADDIDGFIRRYGSTTTPQPPSGGGTGP
jgi:acetyltransferase-like isoleucine patch superfamily enzyme